MYRAKDYDHLLGLNGFSTELLRSHFELYRGYVAATNKLLAAFEGTFEATNPPTTAFAELKRRLAFEFNGMRLHELYFDGLGGDGDVEYAPALLDRLDASFGSITRWEMDFIAVGSMRGIGWAVLYDDLATGTLVNGWLDEHQTGHLVGCRPLLVMDVFEHAYTLDYGLKRDHYIRSFLHNVRWDVVNQRALPGRRVAMPSRRATASRTDAPPPVA
jgi:Fe-Mn family superoxide dismutase